MSIERETCHMPPPGWSCSRAPGHEGPCSAAPDRDDQDWLEACVAEAGRIYTVEGVVMFLTGRNRGLGGERAVDLIQRGEGERVYRYLAERSGGMVAS